MPRGTTVSGAAVDELTSNFGLMSLNHTPMEIDCQAVDLDRELSQDTRRRRRARAHVRQRRRKAPRLDRVGLVVLCTRMAQADAMTHFLGNYQSTLAYWVSLQTDTAVPNGVRSSDARVVAAFRRLDNAIAREPGMLSRLAHVQLIYMFRELEARLAADRQRGETHRDSGCRDASVALNIYMSAQDGSPDSPTLRRTLLERKRIGRRWTTLVGPSPLFLLVYSPETEVIVKNFARFDDATLSMAAAEMVRRAPAELVRLCVLLVQRTEVNVGTTWPDR